MTVEERLAKLEAQVHDLCNETLEDTVKRQEQTGKLARERQVAEQQAHLRTLLPGRKQRLLEQREPLIKQRNFRDQSTRKVNSLIKKSFGDAPPEDYTTQEEAAAWGIYWHTHDRAAYERLTYTLVEIQRGRMHESAGLLEEWAREAGFTPSAERTSVVSGWVSLGRLDEMIEQLDAEIAGIDQQAASLDDLKTA
jgi:hypothetical protein